MESLRQYIFSVVTAAVICSAVKSLSNGLSCKKTIQIICSLYLAVIFLSPVIHWNPDALIQDFTFFRYDDGKAIAVMAEKDAREVMAQHIKSKTEAYILDKADALHAALEVTVLLSEDDIPVPKAVELKGSISPYAKQQLIQILEHDLGISKENQQWIG